MTGRGNQRPPAVGRGTSGAASSLGNPTGNAPATPATPKSRPGRPKLSSGAGRGKPGGVKLSLPGTSSAGSALHPAGAGGTKRARASGGGSGAREPDAKRQKPISGAAAAAVSAANARNAAAAAAAAAAGGVSAVPPPQSPSGGGRGRGRRIGGAKGGVAGAAAAANAAAVAAAVAAAAGNPAGVTGVTGMQQGQPGAGVAGGVVAVVGAGVAAGAGAPGVGAASGVRRASRAPTSARANLPIHTPSSYVSVGGIPMPGVVRTTSLHKRYFGHEIQGLMHAFGEVRYCSREVLEIVEDAVREQVRQVALSAADRAIEVSEQQGVPLTLYKSRVPITVTHVAYSMRKDPRAVHRLNQVFDSVASKTLDLAAAEKLRARRARPAEATWELVRDLSTLPDTTESREHGQHPGGGWWTERLSPTSDIFLACSFRAHMSFQKHMPKLQFQELFYCRSFSFTRQESRSRATAVQGKSRLTLFREWLDLGSKENVYVPDDSLYALGQVAWETVGTITQHALMRRHFDDIGNGVGDPRAGDWSIGRHILAAVGYGLTQGVLIPMTDNHGLQLHDEIEKMYSSTSSQTAMRWRGHGASVGTALQPSHVREAVRRMERAPDVPWGFEA